MGKARERRLLAQMRKADVRKKSTLLIKNYVETVMGGEPLLTELEAFTLWHSFASDEERQEYNTMVSALRSLSSCIQEVRLKHLEVMMKLTFLGHLFGRAKEYRNFEELLNELCLKSDGEYSKRLQERAMKYGRLVPYFYNIGLEGEDDDQKCIVLSLSDQELALTKEVTEALGSLQHAHTAHQCLRLTKEGKVQTRITTTIFSLETMLGYITCYMLCHDSSDDSSEY